MQYNIALILYLYREASQRELYSDTQYWKILNKSRYEYRSQNLVHSRGYIYLRIIHTYQFGSPRRSDRPPSYIIGRQRLAFGVIPCQSYVNKLYQTIYHSRHISSYITHSRYTPPSLNIAVAISRREIAKHSRSKQRATKTRQQNTLIKQHGNTA